MVHVHPLEEKRETGNERQKRLLLLLISIYLFVVIEDKSTQKGISFETIG